MPDFAFNNRDILEIHASDRPEEVLARHDPRPEQSSALVSASRYNLSWGNLAPTFIVCEKAQRCRRRLFASLLFERSNRLSVLLNV